MALTKSPARRPVTSRGTRILRRGFPACTLRPLALLRLPVSATGGGRLRSTSSYGSTKIVLQPKLEDYFGDPYGNRTHVTAVKGPCLNRLTNGPYNTRFR